jgi:predicted GH43/DUF377 family glycosyl hydrolase
MTHNRRSYARDTVHRWEGNPLITISDLDFKCSDIRNASVVQVNDELMLFVDIEHLAGSHCIHLARQQENGRFVIDKDPFMCSSTDPRYAQHESQGVMDPRITFLDDVYYIMYVANGDHGLLASNVPQKVTVYGYLIVTILSIGVKANQCFHQGMDSGI